MVENHYAASEMEGEWIYEDKLLSENVLQGIKNTAMLTERDRSQCCNSQAYRETGQTNIKRFETEGEKTMRNDALFEAPLPHMASYNGTAYAEPEFEFDNEWETTGDSNYSNSELEDEWEIEGMSAYTEPEFEDEWEMDGISAYSEPEFEDEWEIDGESEYRNLEFEDAAEYEAQKKTKKRTGRFLSFLRRVGRGLKKVVRRVVPIIGKMGGALVGGPAGSAIGGAVGSGLAKALKEAEMEVAQMEAEFFGMNEADAEIALTEAAMDAALAEVMADRAASAETDAEAQAAIATTLPAVISSVQARELLRYMPALVQFYSLLAKILLDQGVVGKQFLRTFPHQQRIVARVLTKAARKGEPINSQKAVKTASATAQKVMSSGRATKKAMIKNVAVQSRAARPAGAPRKQRVSNRESEPYCPTCGSR
ncbi:hypothetical protein WA1_07155 [Scytonema hofmannii PCC 7110]|uniref:Uncharacterized protein n=1 Tax=Scytonema hofmannii PCC 7110 TaxID=128403 RepID=A0A139WT54_9CYAN|nr:hypothetical protein [Scytonema hofmannii]KYC35593.1 hypothetical protein WA1_07155 [Scytonema hofmannii PCC 7110]